MNTLGCKSEAKFNYTPEEIASINAKWVYDGETLIESIAAHNILPRNNEGFQSWIEEAFIYCKLAKKPDSMKVVIDSLKKLSSGNRSSIIAYWKGYAYYYMAIFYITVADNRNLKANLEAGIETLSAPADKSSELYALLSLLKAMNIQLTDGLGARKLAKNANNDAHKAVALDDKNLRAHYAVASLDFYTPPLFGGMSAVTENSLQKAIGLKKKYNNNPYLPSWGKNFCYEMLIKYYSRKEEWEKAKRTYAAAIEEFPEDYLILNAGKKLIGK